MILYFIQSTTALLLLIGIYHAFLKKITLFKFNRFYLLTALLCSLAIPSLAVEFSTNTSQLIEPYQELSSFGSSIDYSTDNILILGKQKATPLQRFTYSFLLFSYLIISCFFLIRFILNLYFLLALSQKGGPQLGRMQSILISQKSNPFSFFRFLFIHKDELENVKQNESILLHEEAHSIQKHSIDILVIEVTQCIFWFNPVLWLYRKAIKENHEFLADNYATAQHSNHQQYLVDLLQFVKVKTQNPLSSSFSYLKIKNRIKMIHKKQPTFIQKTTQVSFSFVLACSILLVCSFKPVLLENQYKSLELNLGSVTPSILPIDEDKITAMRSSFGMRTNPISKTKQMHNGIDISAPEGTTIIATADGTIQKAIYSSGYGNHIKIIHDHTYQTMYAHLKTIHVEEGQKVKTGDVIGVIGNTGKSLGRHLHYEVIKDNKKVNPADYFQFEIQKE
ncbi:MAG: peptidoglycan DD-metalloendopeptidase family protein [Flavobacteriales bacterium]|nr:peptidoglycan DD-metalloendopeptidase family protein [Flavobacteriales bacterium]